VVGSCSRTPDGDENQLAHSVHILVPLPVHIKHKHTATATTTIIMMLMLFLLLLSVQPHSLQCQNCQSRLLLCLFEILLEKGPRGIVPK